jgi:hypothetical protein
MESEVRLKIDEVRLKIDEVRLKIDEIETTSDSSNKAAVGEKLLIEIWLWFVSNGMTTGLGWREIRNEMAFLHEQNSD